MCDVCKKQGVRSIDILGFEVCEHCYENVYYNFRPMQLAVIRFTSSRYKDVCKGIKYSRLSHEKATIVSEILDFLFLVLTDDSINIKTEYLMFISDINKYGGQVILDLAQKIYNESYYNYKNISFDIIDNFVVREYI